MRILKIATAVLLLFIAPAAAEDPQQTFRPTPVEPGFANARIPGPDGAIRRFVQLLWIEEENRLARVALDFWDPLASEGHDLTWHPTEHIEADTQASDAWGEGKIVWRRAGSRPYDRNAIQAVYDGRIVDGRFVGQGHFLNRSGVEYSGTWVNGMMDGQGTLRRPNGDLFSGTFRNGKADGAGRLETAYGEIFEGAFRNGARHGPGKLRLANGQSFRSEWQDGVEILSKRIWMEPPEGLAPELVQSGPADLRFGVAVDRRIPPDALPNLYQPYDSRLNGSTLEVFPGGGDFVNLWRGGAVIEAEQPSIWGLPDERLPANFVMSIENTNPHPLQVVSGFLSVQTSESDRDPFIQIKYPLECGARTYTTINFFNWSGAQPTDARLTGGFISTDGTRYLTNINVDQIPGWPQTKVDFESILPQLGPEIAALGQADLQCPSNDYEGCLRSAKANGLLGILADGTYLERNSLKVDYFGDLSYSWQDHRGQMQSKTSKVRFPIKFGQFARAAECGEGSDAPSAFPNPFNLPLDRQNYRLPFQFPAQLAPGQTSSWTFQIDAEASSRHVFQMVLELSDGRQVASQLIDLTYFKPIIPWLSQ